MKTKRDYKKEYRDFHGKPDRIAERSQRNKARRLIEKKVGDLPRTKEIDHKKPIAKGGTNSLSNLRIVSRSVNRRKGKK